MLIRTINHQIHYIYITSITIKPNTREIINHYPPLSTIINHYQPLNQPTYQPTNHCESTHVNHGEIPRQVAGVGARPIVSEPTPRPLTSCSAVERGCAVFWDQTSLEIH
jgi:hypothetical protein